MYTGAIGHCYRPLGGQSGKGGDVSTTTIVHSEQLFNITFPIIGKMSACLQTCSVPLQQRLRQTVKPRPS